SLQRLERLAVDCHRAAQVAVWEPPPGPPASREVSRVPWSTRLSPSLAHVYHYSPGPLARAAPRPHPVAHQRPTGRRRPESQRRERGAPGPEGLQPIVQEAIARWAAAGIYPARLSALSQVTVGIAEFPGPWLGMAFPGAIWIDQSAAGYGWYFDPSPVGDVAF